MRIFKVKKQGIIYKVYEGLQDLKGVIFEWELKGRTIHRWQAEEYIRMNGREFNEYTDRVIKTWDGYGRYMKSNNINY
jgi:hypothetical protein